MTMERKSAMTIRVIAPWGQETGFRLAGAQVVNALDEKQFNAHVERAIEGRDVGVLAIPAEMEKWLSEKNQKILKKSATPLLARYEYPGEWRYMEESADISEWLTYRAIGYHMRIKL